MSHCRYTHPFVALLVTASSLGAQAAPSAPVARALVDTALARMGGAALARDVHRARFELMTQWQRTVFEKRPYADLPSYEPHSELRDYDVNAWRNVRRFNTGTTTMEIVDVVNGSVAIRRSPGGPGGVAAPGVANPGTWVPLNIAYVDERHETFAMTPERLLLAAREARDLRTLRDTLIGNAAYARVRATVDGYLTTVSMRRSTGFLGAAHFRAAAPNDFGLVPWGEMNVETWYSGWRKQPNGLVYPFQWDVRRAGAPYKRTTVVSATFNPAATPDSFAITDSLRAAYLATSVRPMHEIPLDSARRVDDRFVAFNTPGAPAGAVKLGSAWVLLESGQAPSSAERAWRWVSSADAGGVVSTALITSPGSGHGGLPWLLERHVRVLVAPGAGDFASAVLRGHAAVAAGWTAVSRPQWHRVGGDSLWLEPMDLPDASGALVAYSPSLEWVYSASAATPLNRDLVLALARARGWRVSRIGSARAPTTTLTEKERLPRGKGGVHQL